MLLAPLGAHLDQIWEVDVVLVRDLDLSSPRCGALVDGEVTVLDDRRVDLDLFPGDGIDEGLGIEGESVVSIQLKSSKSERQSVRRAYHYGFQS